MASVMSELNRKGGTTKLRELLRNGTFVTIAAEIMLLGRSRKALELANLAGQMKVQKKLRKRYSSLIEKTEGKTDSKRTVNKTVWLSWLQGMDNAPMVVQKCYESVKEQFGDWNIVVITSENYKDYTDFPQYILDKVGSGIITRTHFSDLLRIELLSKNGGLWLDATVYCTGRLPEDILFTDFFVYQSLKPGHTGHSVRLSSWLMWSVPNAYVIEQTKKLLWNYWQTENKMFDYFLLHHFMTMVLDENPDEAIKILPVSNTESHVLLLRLFEEFDPLTWEFIKKLRAFKEANFL